MDVATWVMYVYVYVYVYAYGRMCVCLLMSRCSVHDVGRSLGACAV